jgi:RHS repeat-associated protein
MKKFTFIISILFLSANPLLAQTFSPEKTYTANQIIRKAGVTTEAAIPSLVTGEISNSVTYYDGMGRPDQQVIHQGSPTGKDIIQHLEYDLYGKPGRSYLPYASTANSGLYATSALSALTTFYNTTSNKVATDANPWADTEYERSPFSRVKREGSYGAAWQLSTGRNVHYEYLLNTAADNVYQWEITAAGDAKLASTPYYPANSLQVLVVKDENWVSANGNSGIVKSFTNWKGQKILVRAYKGNDAHDTYYVYDDFGNLRYIIPPKAIELLGSDIGSISNDKVFTNSLIFPSSYPRNTVYYYMPSVTVTLPSGYTYEIGFELRPYPLNTEIVANLLYVFKYDVFNRIIESKSPGAEVVYTVYDKWHRPVLTQDGNQRQQNEWSFVKYDHMNRPILTGYFSNASTRSSLQTLLDSEPVRFESRGSVVHGYTNNAYPKISEQNQYMSSVYYDDYDFASGWGTAYQFDSNNGVNNGPFMKRPRGKVTGGKIRIVDDNAWLKSVVYYDYEYQEIQSVDEHHLGYQGMYNKSFISYDFEGKVSRTELRHFINSNKSVVIKKRNEYDNSGRLLRVYHQLDNQPEILMTKLDYNELGQLIDKKVHSRDQGYNFMQSVDFRYNIRGWLRSINNASRTNDGILNDDTGDLFGMELYYNTDPVGLNFPDQYNGNISGMTWSNNIGNKKRSYGFNYDALDRLTASAYKEHNGSTWTNTGYFDENITGYDKNGNITALNRRSNNTTIDNLTYTYEDASNLLKSVSDASGNPKGFKNGASTETEYGYDKNGNLKYDLNKGITNITYNRIDMPDVVTFSNGIELRFTYDASGAKLAQKIYQGGEPQNSTDYVGGFIYENNFLRLIATSEGRILVSHPGNDLEFEYQYFLTDHLGNVRVVYGEQVYKATMESELSTTEEAQFKNIAKTRVNNTTYNHTAPSGTVSSPNKSAMLNSHLTNADGTRRIVGPAKGLKVYAGDVVNMEVWARYTQVNTTKISVSTFLFAAMTASFGITPGDNPQVYNAFNSFMGGTTLFNQNSGDVPKAFLNYIFFDKNYANPQFGYIQAGSAAGSSHQKLSLTKPITDEGYIYIYVSNESNLNVNFYFDDLVIRHDGILQADEYFAYGLPVEDLAFKREDIVPNRFLYQGKEWMDEDDAALSMYDFHARMYDPALGRFMGMDPQGQFVSPYMGMGNNPVIGIDPDGEFVFAPLLVAAAIGAGIGAAGYTASVGFSEGGFSNWNWGGLGRSMAIGAVSGVATAGIGSAFVGSAGIGGEIGRAMAHGMANSTIGAAFGENPTLASYATGAIGSLSGSVLKGATPLAQIGGSALTSGITSEINGGDFWKGAATGATITSLNHLGHATYNGIKNKILINKMSKIEEWTPINLSKNPYSRVIEGLRIANALDDGRLPNLYKLFPDGMKIQDLFDMNSCTPEAGWTTSGGNFGLYKSIGSKIGGGPWIQMAMSSYKLGSVDYRQTNRIFLYSKDSFATRVALEVFYTNYTHQMWIDAKSWITRR